MHGQNHIKMAYLICVSVGQLVKVRCLFRMPFIVQSPDVVIDATEVVDISIF